jgi:hypothetical protein
MLAAKEQVLLGLNGPTLECRVQLHRRRGWSLAASVAALGGPGWCTPWAVPSILCTWVQPRLPRLLARSHLAPTC